MLRSALMTLEISLQEGRSPPGGKVDESSAKIWR